MSGRKIENDSVTRLFLAIQEIVDQILTERMNISPKEEARRQRMRERCKLMNAKRMAQRRAKANLVDSNDMDELSMLPKKQSQSYGVPPAFATKNKTPKTNFITGLKDV